MQTVIITFKAKPLVALIAFAYWDGQHLSKCLPWPPPIIQIAQRKKHA